MDKKKLSEKERLEYRKKAKLVFRERADYFASSMGLSFNRIAIREQRTRWGSCSSKKNLNFNWKLLLAPPQVLDYVVVHELCHLKQMNHSKAFWTEVEAVLPDYKERKRWLRENGAELMNI